MAAIFPDHFLHIGGDENNGVEWKSNPRIQTFMREHNFKDTAALQNYFNEHLLKIVEKHGKHMIGWDRFSLPTSPKMSWCKAGAALIPSPPGPGTVTPASSSAGYY